MTVDEMIEQLTNLRVSGWGGAELAFDSQHGCCDPMGFTDAATCYPAHSLARLFKTDTPRPVVVLHTSGGLS